METNTTAPPVAEKRFGWPQVLLIVLAAMLATVALTLWLVKYYLFPSAYTPVVLDAREQQILSNKLELLDSPSALARKPSTARSDSSVTLQPQLYSEAGASREVHFSERELNAMLAKNTDLARKVAIDLSDNLISANILVPMEPDFPVLGGKTIRVKTGVELAYREGRAVVRLKGVSVMGVPLPNAWLGGLKNIDLVQEFGNDPGFWRSFADGVAAARVEEGQLTVKLHE